MPLASRRRRRAPGPISPGVEPSLLDQPAGSGEGAQGALRDVVLRGRPPGRRSSPGAAMTFDPRRVFGQTPGSQGELRLDPEAARYRARQGQAGSRHAGATPAKACDCALCRFVPG